MMYSNKRKSCISPQLEWLNELRFAAELETMSVLFAKSVAESRGYIKLFIGHQHDPINERRKSRCIARLMPSNPVEDLPDSNHKSLISVPSTSCESLNVQETPEEEVEFGNSLPSEVLSNTRDSINIPLMRRRRKKPGVYRHSIRVNDGPDNRISIITSRPAPSIPKIFTSIRNIKSSSSSISSTSADSGQCSGNSGVHENVNHLARDSNGIMVSSASSVFSKEQKTALPMYARIANSMDHVLRIASTVLTLLDSNLSDKKLKRELIQKTKVYIEITKQSQCGPFLQDDDFDPVLAIVQDLEQQRFPEVYDIVPEYFNIYVRKMIEQSMSVFVKVICVYLNDSSNKDRLLVIALEHMIHLLLFGDDISLEAIRHKAVERLLEFCRLTSTPAETLRLLLRALAVLCGVNKGCVQLLSLGGLDTVLNLLCNSPSFCAVEAAGILTQLTNANHPFIRPQGLGNNVVNRLLDLLDESNTSESVLLCTAALANLSIHDQITELLYQKNAVIRLVRACKRPNCSSAFVYEQTVAIFSRLAHCGYDQALIAQQAIPLLLKMMTITSTQQIDHYRRVRYKAVVCLSSLASTGIGLKAIFKQQGREKLIEALRSENVSKSAPFALLCQGVKNKLEETYYKNDK
ncbi:unnamed protein product [Bursaphelenchus xylophilus]|uniref:(pine wood nematode) hypothetical protein n=1 Tax=Bursaphelenchus xylophilus TaxID=6326 RepID=A0A1I7SW82_BURXY|nr:unnamed protein product [Bursaphelenchus xylophilus]CAG9098972.1 unnamed protein product [Bursaphelenchus xylophilus]